MLNLVVRKVTTGLFSVGIQYYTIFVEFIYSSLCMYLFIYLFIYSRGLRYQNL